MNIRDMSPLQILDADEQTWFDALGGWSAGYHIKQIGLEIFGDLRIRGGEEDARELMSTMLLGRFVANPNADTARPLAISLRDVEGGPVRGNDDPRVALFRRKCMEFDYD